MAGFADSGVSVIEAADDVGNDLGEIGRRGDEVCDADDGEEAEHVLLDDGLGVDGSIVKRVKIISK